MLHWMWKQYMFCFMRSCSKDILKISFLDWKIRRSCFSKQICQKQRDKEAGCLGTAQKGERPLLPAVEVSGAASLQCKVLNSRERQGLFNFFHILLNLCSHHLDK